MTSRPATATTLAAALAEDIRKAELRRLEEQQLLLRQQQREAEELQQEQKQKQLDDEENRRQQLLQGTDVRSDKSTLEGANVLAGADAVAAGNPARILKPVIKTLLTPPSTTATTTSPADTNAQKSSHLPARTSNSTPSPSEILRLGKDDEADDNSPTATVTLLIDKLKATSIVRDGETRETFRLWLSDGEMSIQGLFRHGALDMLIDGTLVEGSYVEIDDYEIMSQPRLSGNGKVLILLVSDARPAGHDRRGELAAAAPVELPKMAAKPTNENGKRPWQPEEDEDSNDPPSPISRISPFSRHSLKSANIFPAMPPGGNDHIYIAAPEPETESVDLLPSPTASRKLTPSVQSTPTPTSKNKRKARDISEDPAGSQQPLSALDANQRPDSRGWMRKRQRQQEQMSPERALKFHSDAFLAQLKAIQASPSKTKQGLDTQITLSPTKDKAQTTNSSPKLSQSSAKTMPFSPSPKKTGSQEAKRQQRLSEIFSPSKKKSSPSKLKQLPKAGENSAGAASSLPVPGAAGQPRSRAQAQTKTNLPPSAQRPVSSLEAQRAPSSSSLQPPKPITRPVRLTPLSAVTGVQACRAKIIDVLVVVSHVNPRLLIRSGFPNSREVLVMDRSTTKQVHLTVFVDAAYFHPPPGSVALMRNITTHEYGGGSLKAYYQRCVGVQWFIPEGDVERGWQAGEWDDEADALRRFWLDNEAARTVPEGTWWTERGAARYAANRGNYGAPAAPTGR